MFWLDICVASKSVGPDKGLNLLDCDKFKIGSEYLSISVT
jgi:hypothetical protein